VKQPPQNYSWGGGRGGGGEAGPKIFGWKNYPLKSEKGKKKKKKGRGGKKKGKKAPPPPP